MSISAPHPISGRACSVALLAGSLTLLLVGCRDRASDGLDIAQAVRHSHEGSQAEAYASVWRVIDGDTVELIFDSPSRARRGNGDGEAGEDDTFEKLRLRGIDTPEHHASSKLDRDAERSALDRQTIRALGTAATAHAESLLPLGTIVMVEGDERDRYGRLVAYLMAEDAAGQPFDFGARMIADGYAHAYDGGGRYPHPRMEYYRALQRQAREQSLGLWATDPDATARLAPDGSP